MKVQVTMTLFKEDIDLARELALARGLTYRGGKLGSEIRGSLSALFGELIREESARVIDKQPVGGRGGD